MFFVSQKLKIFPKAKQKSPLDKRFRRSDPRFHDEHRQRQRRSNRLTLADFRYQEEGRMFRLQGKGAVADGTIYRTYSQEGQGCRRCELKSRCVKGKRTKRRYLMVPVGNVIGNLSKAMAAKIDSEKGRRIIIGGLPLQSQFLRISVL